MSPQTPGPLYVFTYGTLRPGEHNARMARGSVITAETATVDGYALYSNRSRSYPYLVAEEGATTTGTLYLMHPDDRFARIHQMEVGAGYDTAEVDAALADGSTVKALAWVWRRPEYLGPRIHSGDWCAWRLVNEPDWSRDWSNVTTR